MSTQNPYASPESVVEVADMELYQPKIFAKSGRIGRLRFLAYTLGVTTLLGLTRDFLAVSTLSLGVGVGSVDSAIIVIFTIVIIAFAIVYAVRRLNDTDKSGWYSVLGFVPVVNLFLALYLMLAKGSDGGNNFGPAPVPNTLGVKILGLATPVIFVVGILAAIAIPAYQDYVKRASQETEVVRQR